MSYSVGAVARMSGVTVRTLHHYDEIGLLRPGGRTSEQAMDLAEQHRQQIGEFFYDCSYEIHRGLGETYVADHRFTESIDRYAPGLAAYLRDAILANAARPR